MNNDMLLLTTRGRRSGRPHTVPLLYLLDGPHPIVIASWGGRPDHPHWFENLRADPDVVVQIRREVFTARSMILGEPERSIWYARAVSAYPGYEDYQGRTDRIIPVVRLERQRPAGWPPGGECG